MNYFLFEFFRLRLIKQVIDLRKVRFAALKFRTDLQNRVMDGWSKSVIQ